MVEGTVISIKEFVRSYIETYQTCLNTTNSEFISELVKSSDVIREVFMSTPGTIKKGTTNDEFLKAEKERIKQLFKQLLSGRNDIETLESSKQVKMHQNLTDCYFRYVRKIVQDFVPKRIVYKMVNYVVDNIDHYLHDLVFTPYVVNRMIDQVLVEEQHVIDDRNRAVLMLSAVNKALKSIADIQCI
jgi:dynamin 1-like protein